MGAEREAWRPEPPREHGRWRLALRCGGGSLNQQPPDPPPPPAAPSLVPGDRKGASWGEATL